MVLERLADGSRAYHPGPPETAARFGVRGAAGGMTLKMNVSVDSLLAVTVATTAGAVLAMLAAPFWSKARRTRRLAMVDVALATSYIGTPSSAAGPVPIRPLEADAMPGELPSPSDVVSESPAVVGEVLRHDAHRTLLDAAAFEAIVHQEDAREERYRRPTTVVMMELDGLERLVERLGEAAAARVEPDVADTIAKLARRADYVARLAPGRFAVLLPETDEIVAINYVERIRQACDDWLASGAIAMCLAIGWSSTTGKASVTTAMQVAVDRMHAELRRGSRPADGSGDAATD
jgi:diguanylate cyclase (GGDEF)-like protein